MEHKKMGQFNYKGDNLTFYAAVYEPKPGREGVPAIYAMMDSGETYATVTVNLIEYGLMPNPGCVFISADMLSYDPAFLKKFIEEFCIEETQKPQPYGYAEGLHIALKPEYAAIWERWTFSNAGVAPNY